MRGDPRDWSTSDKIISNLGWCGCGNPEAALDLLRDVLTILAMRSERPHPWHAYLPRRACWEASWPLLDEMLDRGESPGLYWSYFYWLDDKGLTDHGGNASGCWLTDDGKALLEVLHSKTSDELLGF